MFKIAYCAGHYRNTPGKRIPKTLDPGETREWILNDRVARYFAEAAKAYPQAALLRTDDPTGKTFLDIPQRCAKANSWGADLYIDMHHNAGIGGGTGGGVVIYAYPGSEAGRKFRDAVYAAVIAAGGLKGNRSQPLQEKAYDSLRLANAPAILAEYGFMDSATDAPVILTEAYARKVGYATMEAVARVAGLEKTGAAYAEEEKQPVSYGLEAFIREVQAAVDAQIDGIAGPETLGKTPTVSAEVDSTHPVVAAVQKRLAALGYDRVGEADGIAGPKFTDSVIAFQQDHNCYPDGELTARNKTWKTLLGM